MKQYIIRLLLLVNVVFIFQVKQRADLQFVKNWVEIMLIERRITWNQMSDSEEKWLLDSKSILNYFCDKYFEKSEMCLEFGIAPINFWAINTATQSDKEFLEEMESVYLKSISPYTIESINSYKLLDNIFRVCIVLKSTDLEVSNTKENKSCYSISSRNGSIKVIDLIK